LHHPAFRALWIAGLVSDFGAWMHEVGEGWLMTSLSQSPLKVALVQAADSLAVFALALPAGALADIIGDRRRLAIATQVWMLFVAALLGALTLTHRISPNTLIALTFAMGIGAALDTPLWQTMVAELVPRKDLPGAVTLAGLSINLARAFAPAIGGIIVAASGPASVFFANAVSFALVGVVLVRWRWVQPRVAAPQERWSGAIRIGLRYAFNSRELVAVLVRTAATLFGGICAMALLPLFARRTLGLGALGFGVLLGAMGVGAIVTAVVLPTLEGKLSAEKTLSAGTIVFAAALAGLAVVPNAMAAIPILLGAGAAWMAIVSSLNVAAQLATPSWVRARVSAVFMLAFQAALAVGAIAWGALATRTSIRVALAGAAATMFVSIVLRFWFPLAKGAPDFSPAAWPKPLLMVEPSEEAGPVLVTLTYRVSPPNLKEFVTAMRDLERIRRREGAYDWGLYRDPASADTYVEVYSIDSWAEHLRQHARVTAEEFGAQTRALRLADQTGEPVVRHLIAVSED
jgi:MFS family permease